MSTRKALPQSPDPIAADLHVRRHPRPTMLDGLADQHAAERVAMDVRQLRQLRNGRLVHRPLPEHAGKPLENPGIQQQPYRRGFQSGCSGSAQAFCWTAGRRHVYFNWGCGPQKHRVEATSQGS